MNIFTRARKGFTLIEMLIVVAVIGVLASLVLVGLGPVQRQGRDARRIQDLRQVQTGLELYFVKHGAYPDTQSWTDLSTLLKGDSLGISNIPNDPSSGKTYVYVSDGSTYVLQASFEDANNPRVKEDGDVSILNTDCSGGYYCVTL